jgi:hypothetical protein
MRALPSARPLAIGICLASIVGVVVAQSLPVAGDGATTGTQMVTAVPIESFLTAGFGEPVQGLVWRGGLEMQSQVDTFGGLSGIAFTGPDHRLTMVSDRGNFISGQLIYDETGRPLSLIGVTIDPIRNSQGNELPRAFARDAEGIATIVRDGEPAAVRVAFENLTRVADFQLVDARPTGPAREVPIPDWLTRTRTNASLESICIAPPASPVAGSTVLLTEGVIDDAGLHAGWLLGVNDRGPLSYQSEDGTNPTDCAFLPNGDLLVLERGIAFLTFTLRLKRVPADAVRPGAPMQGEILLQASGGGIDNMEGLAVHTGPDGQTRITLISDNNFTDWQRHLLLEFSLPE